MTVARQALMIARLQTGQGTSDDKARIAAWDRLRGLLATLDSKTSVLLRFNAIVVAALAYVLVIAGADPFQAASAAIKAAGKFIGHASLLASVVSCGFAFPVINVERDFFGSRIDGPTAGAGGGEAAFDDAALQRLADLVSHRTRLYSWAWRLAVIGGMGFAIIAGLAMLH